MRAAVLNEAGTVPQPGDFDEPDGDVVDVLAAGCNPVDLIMASGDRSQPTVPSVVGQEGVGRTVNGDRVYFNAPPDPFGSWAQRCPIDPAAVFPVPDGVDAALAVSLGIAGLAAWLPLTRHADVSKGQSLLVLGATGTVGRIAIQAARLLGAGKITAAGRDTDALNRAAQLGADATVVLGGDNSHDADVAALRDESGDGYEVVLDMVYGKPFLAALDASATGSTLVTVGLGAADHADIPFWALQGRTHICHGNPLMPPDVVRAAYAELMSHAADGRFVVELQQFSLDDAPQAWQTQADGPHTKIVVLP